MYWGVPTGWMRGFPSYFTASPKSAISTFASSESSERRRFSGFFHQIKSSFFCEPIYQIFSFPLLWGLCALFRASGGTWEPWWLVRVLYWRHSQSNAWFWLFCRTVLLLLLFNEGKKKIYMVRFSTPILWPGRGTCPSPAHSDLQSRMSHGAWQCVDLWVQRVFVPRWWTFRARFQS